MTHARRAVALTPRAWLPHFLLGASLGRTGDVDAGIAECRIAAQLATNERDVDLAKVEIGIILTNAGRDHDARAHLEGLYSGSTDASPHLLYNLGVVRMRCNMFDRALEALTRVIQRDAHHALALDCAAHCAFVVGKRRPGTEYAKRANVLGQSQTYNAWRAGVYDHRDGRR